jgi:hypothetical protein
MSHTEGGRSRREYKPNLLNAGQIMSLVNVIYSNFVSKATKRVIFFNWYSAGVESNWVHSPLWPPIGLLCQPHLIMMMEKLVE